MVYQKKKRKKERKEATSKKGKEKKKKRKLGEATHLGKEEKKKIGRGKVPRKAQKNKGKGKKKKKKKKGRQLSMCKCTWTFLSIKQPHFLSSVFSLFWRENFLVSPSRIHPNPIISFPFSPPNQTHSKKVFIHIFSPKFSIHPILPPNKLTLEIFSFGNLSCLHSTIPYKFVSF